MGATLKFALVGYLLAVNFVAYKSIPIYAADNAKNLVRGVSKSIHTSDNRAHTCASNIVNRYSRLLNILKNTYVCSSLGSTT